MIRLQLAVLLAVLTPFAAAQEAAPRDLCGAWALSGELPNGDAADGTLALVPLTTPGRYRARIVEADGDAWSASVWTEGDGLRLRPYRSTQGVAGALADAKAPWVAQLAPEGEGFAGSAAGAPHTTLRLAPAALPRLSLGDAALDPARPEAVQLEPGARTLPVAVAPRALRKLVQVVAPPALRARLGDEGLSLEAERPGRYTLEARLGGARGALLATLELRVATPVLAQVRERIAAVKAQGQVPVVVFDLDDTLFDTRYRTAALLEDYHRTHGEPRLEQVPVERVHYAMPETLAELGFSEHEVEGQTFEAIHGEVWPKFFRGESLLLDAPILGAVEAVRSLAPDALIVYLTGRKTFVADFSERALAEAGFPTPSDPGAGPGVLLFHKPKSYPGQQDPAKLHTDDFKGLITRVELPKHGVVVAAFDNEPKNCVAFRASAPADAIVVHLDTLYPAEDAELVDDRDARCCRTSARASRRHPFQIASARA
ncbi:MAG: hypothetical protein R3F62_30670 [Planctomycetota bacterium]